MKKKITLETVQSLESFLCQNVKKTTDDKHQLFSITNIV
jgi:hypothetical protein